MTQNQKPRGDVIACLDIGSNATRLRIFTHDATQSTLHEICRRRFPVQLGAGTFTDGRLKTSHISAMEQAIAEAQKLARQYSAHTLLAVATSAVRDASNADEFIAHIKQQTGLTIKLINGAEEARLMALGAVGGQPAFHKQDVRFYVIDIGGGSTELVRLDRDHRQVLSHASLDLGAVRLVQQWHIRAPQTPAQTAAARHRVCAAIRENSPFQRQVKDTVERSGNAIALGLGGTPGALNQILGRNDGATRQQPVSLQLIEETLQLIAASEPASLADRYGLEPSRAELIYAGAIILLSLMETLSVAEMIPTDRGICEGLALDYSSTT